MSDSTSHDTNVGPFDLGVTPIHLDFNGPAVPLTGFGFDGPSFESYIASHCADGPGRIVMIEASPSNWRHWECHTLGDELVIVLAGKANFIQEVSGKEVVLPVEAGSTIINPRGVWHTADIVEPIKAIYLTPAKGTEHRER